MIITYKELPETVKAALAENSADAIADSQTFEIEAFPARLSELLRSAANTVTIGEYIISSSQIRNNHLSAALTEKEVSILKYLANNTPASRQDLLRNVWGYAGDADTNTVETHISRLRQKLNETFGTEIITNKTGGYGLF